MSEPARHVPDPMRPCHPETSDRWLAVATGVDEQRYLCARREQNGISRISLYAGGRAGQRLDPVCGMPHDGAPDRAAIAIGQDGAPLLGWTESLENGWQVVVGSVQGTSPRCKVQREIIHRTNTLCLFPALVTSDGQVWMAWAEYIKPCMRIRLAGRSPAGKWDVTTVSDTSGHSFRPTLAVSSWGVFAAWDQYRLGVHEIVWAHLSCEGGTLARGILRENGRHRLGPTAIADRTGVIHLAFQERTDVVDPASGIEDHAVTARCFRITEQGPERLAGIDLSPGLLASVNHPYRSYDGLRRRPQLTVTGDNTVWLCAEAKEPGGQERVGFIRAHALTGNDFGQACPAHRGGVCYAVPSSTDSLMPWTAFIPSDPGETPVYEAVVLQPVRHPGIPDVNRPWKPRVSVRRPPGAQPPVHPAYRLYWLDLHAHSSRSPDAEGDPDELIHYARDVAGIDGVAIVDNDYYPHKMLAEAEWRMEQALADLYTDPGTFVVFPAYEYTYYDKALTPPLNHRTVLCRGPGVRLHRCTDPGSHTLEQLVAALPPDDTFLAAHHCTWHRGVNDFAGVEICSSWRVCMEETDFVEQRLLAGDRFAFMGSSDSHRACPGLGGALTGVYATALTRDAVFEALCARRTIATQGQRMAVSFTAGDLFIGAKGPVPSRVPLTLQVASPVPIEWVEIIRDGGIIRRMENPGCTLSDAWEDVPGPGIHVYRVRIKTEGDPAFNVTSGDRRAYLPFVFEGPYGSNLAKAHGPFAWTTPIWAEVKG